MIRFKHCLLIVVAVLTASVLFSSCKRKDLEEGEPEYLFIAKMKEDYSDNLMLEYSKKDKRYYNMESFYAYLIDNYCVVNTNFPERICFCSVTVEAFKRGECTEPIENYIIDNDPFLEVFQVDSPEYGGFGRKGIEFYNKLIENDELSVYFKRIK